MGRTRDTPRHRRDADTFLCTRVTRTMHVPNGRGVKSYSYRYMRLVVIVGLALGLTRLCCAVAFNLYKDFVAGGSLIKQSGRAGPDSRPALMLRGIINLQ